jgi:hypothetical protein
VEGKEKGTGHRAQGTGKKLGERSKVKGKRQKIRCWSLVVGYWIKTLKD